MIGAVLVASTTFLAVRAGQAIGAASSASSSHSTPTPAPTHFAVLPAFHGVLTWNDEFKSKAGLKGWQFESGNINIGGRSQHELQWYDQSNATVEHGNLVLTATKGGGGHPCWNGPCQYTSVRMQSTLGQAYGLFEAKIKLAGGRGIWPAFWMQGDNYDKVGLPRAGEIDIAEVNGKPPVKRISGFAHAPNIRPFAALYTLPHPRYDAYHVYGVEWTRKGITWFVDKKVYGYMAAYRGWPFDHPFNIILSLAVGGGWPGPPSASTHFPARMYVNWLRVYRQA